MIPAILLSVCSGLLYGFSFPPVNLSFLAWFFLVPLLLLESSQTGISSFGNSSAESARFLFSRPWLNRFAYGFVSGLTANLIIFFWIWDTFNAAQIGFLTTLNAWFLLSAVLSLYPAVFFALYGFIPSHWFRPFAAGALWVALEGVRSVIMTGFPWALVSHSQAYSTSLIQIASVTGASGIAFLIIGVNSALASMIQSRKEQGKFHSVLRFLPIPLAAALVIFWGGDKLKRIYESQSVLKVAVLQGNIDQYQKWDKAYEESIKARYEELVATAVETEPDLIVWPESATPGWLPHEKEILEWVKNVVKKSQTHHLVGSVSARNGKEYNSAFFFGPDGEILGVYDKQHLVPFGEHIPFGGFLSRWIPYLGSLGTFDAGASPVDFKLAGGGPRGECRLSVNICYEAIFPRLIRKSLTGQTDIIVNITNDGWFLDTGAPEQHYVTNIFRAIENGRPVIRAANTGISAVIDEKGRDQVRSTLLTQDVLVASVPIGERKMETFYTRWGAWFDYLCWALTVLGLTVFIYSPACPKSSIIKLKR